MKIIGVDTRATPTKTYSASDLLSFSQLKSDEDWTITREPVSAPVSGAGGVYDFYYTSGASRLGYNYPPAPMTIKKKMRVLASSGTYATIETALNELRLFTIAHNLRILWGEMTDGTKLWTYAKCTALASNQKIGAYTYADVDIAFFCPTGLWYGTQRTEAPGPFTAPGVIYDADLTVYGNYPQPLYINIAASTGTVTELYFLVTADIQTCYLEVKTASVLPLAVNSASNTLTPAARYAAAKRAAGQSATFLWLDPRYNHSALAVPYNNNLQIVAAGTATGSITEISWWDAYLL